MPRGRPKKKELGMEDIKAGPEKSVALDNTNIELEKLRKEAEMLEKNQQEIERLKEKIAKFKEKTKPKDIEYSKFIFHNMEDPGIDISFAYNGVAYHVEEGQTYEFPKEVVDHLSSLKIVKSRFELDKDGNKRRTNDEFVPRFLCQVLETFKKAV